VHQLCVFAALRENNRRSRKRPVFPQSREAAKRRFAATSCIHFMIKLISAFILCLAVAGFAVAQDKF
jgi:hypothetical protein